MHRSKASSYYDGEPKLVHMIIIGLVLVHMTYTHYHCMYSFSFDIVHIVTCIFNDLNNIIVCEEEMLMIVAKKQLDFL